MNKYNKTKKLVLFLGSFNLGGSERQAHNLAVYCKNHGYEVQIWALSGPGVISKMCDADGGIKWKLVAYYFPPFFLIWLLGLFRLWNDLRKESPDILISYTLLPNVLGGLLWRFTKVKQFYWNQRDEGIEDCSHFWQELSSKLTNNYISNSLGGKNYLTNKKGIPETKIDLIHNGVRLLSPKRTRSEWRKKLNIPQKATVAVHTVTLSAYRDLETLFSAISKVVATDKNVYFVFAGRIDEKVEHTISDKVKFLGFIDDISGLLAAGDVFIHCSKSEGNSNSMIEAALAGLPVVATDILGNREVLSVENLKYLVPVGDDKKFSENILKFDGSKALRNKIGSKNRQKSLKAYSYEVNMRKYIDLFNQK